MGPNKLAAVWQRGAQDNASLEACFVALALRLAARREEAQAQEPQRVKQLAFPITLPCNMSRDTSGEFRRTRRSSYRRALGSAACCGRTLTGTRMLLCEAGSRGSPARRRSKSQITREFAPLAPMLAERPSLALGCARRGGGRLYRSRSRAPQDYQAPSTYATPHVLSTVPNQPNRARTRRSHGHPTACP